MSAVSCKAPPNSSSVGRADPERAPKGSGPAARVKVSSYLAWSPSRPFQNEKLFCPALLHSNQSEPLTPTPCEAGFTFFNSKSTPSSQGDPSKYQGMEDLKSEVIKINLVPAFEIIIRNSVCLHECIDTNTRCRWEISGQGQQFANRERWLLTLEVNLRCPTSKWLSGEETACQCRRLGFYPWVRKIPRRRKW